MNRAELWRRIQQDEPELATLMQELKTTFGKVELLRYERR